MEHLFYLTEFACTGISCPPCEAGMEVACVVYTPNSLLLASVPVLTKMIIQYSQRVKVFIIHNM